MSNKNETNENWIKVDGEQSMGVPTLFLTIFLENVFCDLDLCTHNLENRISSWSNCGKYFCKFWFKCRSYINFTTISMTAVARP